VEDSIVTRLRFKVLGAAEKIRSIGWKVEGFAWKIGDLENKVRERNLDFWNMANDRDDFLHKVALFDKRERKLYKEIDKLAAMYWKATGTWPAGHPQGQHMAFRYDSPPVEGAIGVHIKADPPFNPYQYDLSAPPEPKMHCVPMNRYGETIDLSEVEEFEQKR
jgi:hypothetical protein